MNEKIKVTEGNSFILAIPLIAVNAAGEESPIQVDELTELVCRVYSPCGNEYGVSMSSIDNRIFLQVPANMPRGVYNVDTTARRDEQRISLRLKDCFEIVAWDKQSNWQDYIIDGVVELPTQPTIIGAMNIDIPADLEVNTLKAAGTVTADKVKTTGHITAGGDVIAARMKTKRIVNPENGKTEMVWKNGKVEVSNEDGTKIATFDSDLSALLKLFYEQEDVVFIGRSYIQLGRALNDHYLVLINDLGMDCRTATGGDPQVVFKKDQILMDYMRLHNGIFEVYGGNGTHCQLRLGTLQGPGDGWLGCEYVALRLTDAWKAFLQGQNGVFIGNIGGSDDCLHPSEENYKPFSESHVAYISIKDGEINMRGDKIHLYRRGDDTTEVFRLAINSTGGLNFAKYDISDGHLEEELNFSWNDLVALKALIS